MSERLTRFARMIPKLGGSLVESIPAVLKSEDPPALSERVDLRRAFIEHGPRIERFLARLGVSRADAEDLVAETFLVAHRDSDRFDPSRPIAPWLMGIAANLARRQRRRGGLWSKIRQMLEGQGAAPDAEALLLHVEETQRVRAALERLPHRRRELIVLREFEGLSAAEIGLALNMSESAVNTALHRARKAFVRLYHEQVAEETR